MARYVALARGINVGGKHSVPMAALREVCEQIGCTGVRTLIQSGNVVLDSKTSAAALEDALTRAASTRFGFDIPFMVRTAKELRAVDEHAPFPDADPQRLYVVFLARGQGGRDGELDPTRSPPDRAVLKGNEIWMCCPGGVGRTKLTAAWLEKQAGGRAGTTRNWQTLGKLIALAEEA
jgi:uncharacterized protein (DUF1697 family)